MNIKVKNSGIVNLQKVGDVDGNLYIAEAMKNIPFDIKRVFFINKPSSSRAIRGRHAHKSFVQAIFCLNGSFVLNLDDGKEKQVIKMKDPGTGILLGPLLWHTMSNLSKDCVILVLSDAWYGENDYIRNYKEFLRNTND